MMNGYFRIAILLALSSGQIAFAQSAELKQYLAIRDSFQQRTPKSWPPSTKINWDSLRVLDRDVLNRLSPLARAIVGSFNVPGLVQPGRFNVVTFLPGGEDSYLADGMLFSSPDSQTNVLVSTPELIRAWQNGGDPIEALSRPKSLNRVFYADAAITPYVVIPVARAGKVLVALLIARQQDYWPSEKPDRILLSLIRGRQLVVVEAPAPVTIAAPACEGPDWLKPVGALRPFATAAESLYNFPFPEDAAYRICYSRRVTEDPRWPQIVARAEQLTASILGR